MTLRNTPVPLRLPIGWVSADRAKQDPCDVPADAMVWLNETRNLSVTGLLASLRAPFSFNLLSRLVNLRATGKPPVKTTDTPFSGSVASVPAGVTESPHPAVRPKPSAETGLQRLADEAVQYVEAIKALGQLKLAEEDDVAIARLLTEVTRHGLDVTNREIRDAVRAAFERRKTG
jgi:hypothetical protein